MKSKKYQIVHISPAVHAKLKLFIAQLGLINIKTNLSKETEIAILKHLKTK